jgi:hypothetical protein
MNESTTSEIIYSIPVGGLWFKVADSPCKWVYAELQQ